MESVLIYSTVIAFLNVFLSNILKPIISALAYEGKYSCKTLRQQILITEEEMKDISAKDEFAKYARSQRKLNKLKDMLKDEAKKQMESTMKLRLALTYSLRAFIGLVSIVLFWFYRRSPVFILPEHWLNPFSGIISWPSSINGGIGLPFWFFVSSNFAKAVHQLLDLKT